MFTSQDMRNNKIREMYDSGMTLLQIADKLGLTKQRVHQTVRINQGLSEFQLNKINLVLFPAIRDWMIGYKITIKEFCDTVSKTSSNEVSAKSVESFLINGSKTSVCLIQDILKVTGMSFEEAFKED